MKEKTVTFIGHSKCIGIDKKELEQCIEAMILGVKTTFLCGGMGEYDYLCAHTVDFLKKRYSEIKLFLVIPYLTFNIHNRDIYDEIIYPEGFENYFFKRAIVERNKYLVDNSAVAVCYVVNTWGGAAKTYKYAEKREIELINLV